MTASIIYLGALGSTRTYNQANHESCQAEWLHAALRACRQPTQPINNKPVQEDTCFSSRLQLTQQLTNPFTLGLLVANIHCMYAWVHEPTYSRHLQFLL
jgi:hypothetical protein